ncbi:MAG: nicotinate (nicotinamide) nucleotide adenylyltransferase [Planctomycetaceae bacterium]|jgi:nicotinate-nucleotide adenylyltransferase|nr:nicotinate (nicotinamide) nucleotide adenylyltransferase [Planctomycetaceae bacterium]
MRYGIYGGAFDPIHLGHLLLAESCLREAELDRVIFVPTGISPHKNSKNSYFADAQDRYNMISLAIENCNEFEVSRCEIDRGETSYTIDTLRYFHNKFNNVTEITDPNYCNENYSKDAKNQVEFFLIIGCDTFCVLQDWQKIDEVLKLSIPLVALRAGWQLPKTDINYISVNMPIIDISSTRIRNMLAKNIIPRFLTTEKVLEYIKNRKLYFPSTQIQK